MITRRIRIHLVPLVVLAASSVLAAPGLVPPAAPAPATPATPAGAAVDLDALGEEVPRGAVRQFLIEARRDDDAAAARYLDLTPIPEEEREARGPDLARQLKIVLDRTLWIDLDLLSDRASGFEDDGLPPDKDRLGTIQTGEGPTELLLKRVTRPDGARVWRIAPSTVRRIPDLYAELGYPPFVDRLPERLVRSKVLETAAWQWIGLALIAAASWALAFVVTWILRRAVDFLARRTHTTMDDRIASSLHRPVRITITLYLFLAGSLSLRLAVPVQSFLVSTSKGLTVLLLTWMFLRVADIVAHSAQERMIREDRRSAVSMVNLGRRAAKILILGLGVIGLLQNLGFNVTGILAGLGIGGLAVALAAQKTLENVFGGVALTADRPIRVGDLCRFGDKQGTVEDVGLRSTRIRTLDRTVVSVPNAELAAIQIENFTIRDRFRLLATLGVRYETSPDQIRSLVARVGERLASHPAVSEDPRRVRFVGFGPSSLDVEILAFVETTDVHEFYRIREELLLGVMEDVRAAGTSFAFPSQTVYLGRDRAPEDAR